MVLKWRLTESFRFYRKFGLPGARFFWRFSGVQNEVKRIRGDFLSHPIFLRTCTSDMETFYQIFIREEYEIEYERPVNVIFDCGANIGLAAIYYIHKFPDAQIISIEPEESNFEMLEVNTRLYPGIKPVKAALWPETKPLNLKDLGRGEWGFEVDDCSSENAKRVDGISISQLMRDHKIKFIDVLKIDIEGAEKELFETDFKEWLVKTKTLVIEIHDQLRPGAAANFYGAIANLPHRKMTKGENVFVFLG